MPHRNLAVIFVAALISLACYHKAPQNKFVRTITNVMRQINNHYVEEVDERELFENAMGGMVSGLDQYSTYISPDTFAQFQASLDQEFGGIGIVVEGPPRTDRLTVVSPLVGTPAYKAGMRSGDVILSIDGTDTEGMTLEQAVKRMRGPRGTPVDLRIRRGEQAEIALQLNRDLIPIESVLGDRRIGEGKWDYLLEDDPEIGYIRLTTFGEHSVDELETALAELSKKQIKGLVLDLRGNAGGLLGAAVATCDMFIERGVIVSTRGRSGSEKGRYEATSRVKLDPDIPMAILTNQASASASEIVAACLKDHERAITVGERTWGKGSVQNIIQLEGGRSALKLTTASYWRPSGKNIHRTKDAGEEDDWGVRPSDGYAVKLEPDDIEKILAWRRYRDIVRGPGEASPPEPTVEKGEDPQLNKALEYLREQAGKRAATAKRA